ncbi:MAG TPA: hypothetical protein VJ863_08615 [Sphaerochaeta sp.]|nr:hypothetical protein [Sphaerochaeta sp.]
MNKIAKTALLTIILILATSCLWASSPREETAVFRLTAYIPGNPTTTIDNDGFFVASYAYAYSYSMHQNARTKVFTVVAT